MKALILKDLYVILNGKKLFVNAHNAFLLLLLSFWVIRECYLFCMVYRLFLHFSI